MTDFQSGSYKNKRDMQDKLKAQKKLLQLQIELNKKEARSFKEKAQTNQSVVERKMNEMPRYATTQEELLDIQAQTSLAIKNVKELLPKAREAENFVQMHLDGDMTDPLDGSLGPIPKVSLFNVYFDRFKTSIKGVKIVSSASLAKLYDEFLDSLEEDLLPKTIQLNTLQGILDNIKSLFPSREIDELRDIINEKRFTEKEYAKFIEKLLENTDLTGVGNVLNMINASSSSKKGLPAMPLLGLTPSTPPAVASSSVAPDLDDDKEAEMFFDVEMKTKPWLNTILREIIDESGGVYKKKDSKNALIDIIKNLYDSPRKSVVIDSIRNKKPWVDRYGVFVIRTKGVRGRPARVVGKGVSLVDIIDKEKHTKVGYSEFGKLQVSKDKLKDNILSLYLLNSYRRPIDKKIGKNMQISDSLKKIIEKFIKSEGKDFDLKTYYKLNEREKTILIKVFREAGFLSLLEKNEIDVEHDETYINEGDKDVLDRFNLVRGQIIAGNNHSDVLSELKDLARELHKRHYLSVFAYNKIIKELV